jgi:HSP20 family molecular chaperone IbpA
MFNKKKCKRCLEKFSNSFDFCPHCGFKVSGDYEDKEDWGMIGKNDFFPSTEIKIPMGFNTLFGSLMKNLEGQMKEMDKEFGKVEKENKKMPLGIRQGGISISISTSPGKQPEIRVKSHGNIPEFKQREMRIKEQAQERTKNLSEESLKKYSKLPRQEPRANVRRFSDKIVYEIDLPGVKSLKDVSVIKLENSIEIKAVAKDKAYFKLIPVNLQISDYKISKEKLILELDAGE